MRTCEVMAGEHISKTAKRMVALAKKTKGPVTAKFNDIALTAKPGDKPEAIVQHYQTKSNRRHKKYVRSPEYKRLQREALEARLARFDA